MKGVRLFTASLLDV